MRCLPTTPMRGSRKPVDPNAGTLRIKTARVFRPLLEPMRYKGAYGGRGSGKSHFFAEMLVERAITFPSWHRQQKDADGNPLPPPHGLRAVCIREVQKTLAESSKRTIEDKIMSLGVGHLFEVGAAEIKTPEDGLIIFTGMRDHNAESIKSLEGYSIAWIEEAQTISERSLQLLRPTIRTTGSEIWSSWNATSKRDAIDKFLIQDPPKNAIVVKANWRDNPFWNDVLEAERTLDYEKNPDEYPHIWEGEYATSAKGAYFARVLSDAKRDKRITTVAKDPLLPLRAFVDIGGAGAEADAFVIWICQWVGQEIRVLDYYEAIGQVLAEHVQWLRSKGYERAIVYLPHDGINVNNLTGKTYADHLREAGLYVEPPVPNQGRGAASLRIEAVRRLSPQLWFNDVPTTDGRTALGYYHEKRDDARKMGMGPEHDWSSHAADAFGLMAISYRPPSFYARQYRKIEYPQMGYV